MKESPKGYPMTQIFMNVTDLNYFMFFKAKRNKSQTTYGEHPVDPLILNFALYCPLEGFLVLLDLPASGSNGFRQTV